MVTILDGKKVRDGIIVTLQEKLERDIKLFSVAPTLAILQVGARPDSDAFIKQKKLFGEKIGVKIIHTIFPETVTEKEVLEKIDQYNKDKTIHGILLQIP